MTKARELQLLDVTIAQFGHDSYLGPWLADSRAQIAADIQSDVCISAAMPGQARREGAAILEAAKRDAAQILADATEQARLLVEKARKDAADVRSYARARLDEAMRRL